MCFYVDHIFFCLSSNETPSEKLLGTVNSCVHVGDSNGVSFFQVFQASALPVLISLHLLICKMLESQLTEFSIYLQFQVESTHLICFVNHKE